MCEDDVIQIVHDLKSPLLTISLESELLDATIDTIDQAALYRAVNRILMNVTFLDRMVQDLLDLSAIDRGRFSIARVSTELRALLEQTVERAVPTRDRERITLSAPQRVFVYVDELRIERVISNFLHNALKYAPRTSHININLEVHTHYVRASVLDNGPGIAPADQAHIFDKYRRAADARTHDGSGLGLYVSKRIVEAHGGRIGVHSVQGAGSCFFFELPLAG